MVFVQYSIIFVIVVCDIWMHYRVTLFFNVRRNYLCCIYYRLNVNSKSVKTGDKRLECCPFIFATVLLFDFYNKRRNIIVQDSRLNIMSFSSFVFRNKKPNISVSLAYRILVTLFSINVSIDSSTYVYKTIALFRHL